MRYQKAPLRGETLAAIGAAVAEMATSEDL